LVLLLVCGLATGAGAAEPDPQTQRAPLTIASEPAGAAVFLDGQPKGVTPLRVPDLPAGDHRVRLVKDGYLDNSRVLSLRAGEPRDVQVKLTPHAPQAAGTPLRSTQVDPNPPQQGGGGGKKAILIGLGVVAVGAVAYLALRDKNAAPTAGTISVSPTGTGLQGATAFTFTAQGASDPDGDSLTYSWTFGDGGTASGQTASRTFTSAGSISVNLSVSDGKKSATAAAVNVDVRNLTGTWRGDIAGFPFTFVLTQSGSSVSGSYSDEDGPGTVTGTVSSPRTVNLTVNQPPFTPFTFTGTADASINTISGSVFGFPFTMSR